MLKSVLIANRGEIACRVVRTCRNLGITTVAVVEQRELGARHSLVADHCVTIDSYLNMEAIIAAAKAYDVAAIHPGYGYLSENAEFATAVTAAGIKFIGPSSEAMLQMGSKANAKQVAEANDVPTIPGYQGSTDLTELQQAAKDMGFPLLIKAVLGGGGKGLRRVNSLPEFQAHLEGAQREAAKAFASTEVILEAYLENPRHIEVQLMADQHGNVIVFGDRDCSLQRRYQKVIEEAPATGIDSPTRQAMHDCAKRLAEAVNYEGAGTVEFLLCPDGQFYFLEMNTRLQVEHPVTEAVFGMDLVEQQLRVATGEELTQNAQPPKGHAIEVRLYAEDPYNGFLPTTGKLTQWQLPEQLRLEPSYNQGDAVTIHYDPMLAKLIAVGDDRQSTYQALQQGLDQVKITGITTNIDYLRRLATHPGVVNGLPGTMFIDALMDDTHLPSEAIIAAVLWLSDNAHTSWHGESGWRLNGARQYRYDFIELATAAWVLLDQHTATVSYGDLRQQVSNIHRQANSITWQLDSTTHQAQVYERAGNLVVVILNNSYELRQYDIHKIDLSTQEADGHLLAPMPGQITAVMVAQGDQVAKGSPLMILEAMKMEHTITAPQGGQVEQLFFQQGDFVDDKAELISIVANGNG